MAEDKEVPKWRYYWKGFKWLAGNTFWALLPLWFMMFLNLVSGGKVGKDEINHLVVHDGVILFVCCAIMGSALVELILTGIKLRVMAAYSYAIIPCFIALLILTNYALILAKIIDYECFSLASLTSRVVIILTIIFCIFTKAEIYIKEDTKHE